MEWKYDDKGRKVSKEERAAALKEKKDKKKEKKSPEPNEKPQVTYSCREDAIEAFKQVPNSTTRKKKKTKNEK